MPGLRLAWILIPLLGLTAGCSDSGIQEEAAAAASSCMQCHNGSQHADYAGPGLENPHPFPGADNLECTVCHGGDPNGVDAETSHVPPPPEIGDRENLRRNRTAYFNRLTLTGIDKFDDYDANGRTWSALDYLQFVNPGDLRVATAGRACGQCHADHAECVATSPLATETGVFSGAAFAAGVENRVASNVGLDQDTAADIAFRAITDPDFFSRAREPGEVPELLEYPVISARGDESPEALFRNDLYDAAGLADDVNADGSLVDESPLARLYHEQVAFTCGDCHLGSAGANNRAGDFRSSGCTACHMPYSLGGRTGSRDPNVRRDEPRDPDDIDEPERAHVRAHRIASIAKTLPDGTQIQGIDDLACAGCHQGSNRTVMQYWGIRLDQNQDLRNDEQYPANPVEWRNTRNDERLFDPDVGNRTFNGRNANQYIAFEDYDGDERDDTPADVHHEAGMGCIDCHGSYDLHGGAVGDPRGPSIVSRQEQAVAIACESCHGSEASYAPTVQGTTYDGRPAELAVDRKGNPLRHVYRDTDGHYYMVSRLTGARHYVRQTLDTIVDNGRTHPMSGEPLYSAPASFAMGRDDGDPATGLGPHQTNIDPHGFSHGDSMNCTSCHAAWTNTCMGCHLVGEYDEGNNFSNITGERIVFREKNAEFIYQSPVPFQLAVGPHGDIVQTSSNTKVFFSYEDRENDRSRVFAFTDRLGQGANPAAGFGALGHNAIMAHSIRGKVGPKDEGPRYCTACHLTENGLANFGAEYDLFRAAIAENRYGDLDFQLLRQHIGQNPNNQLDSPLWVHMVAGLGSGLFAFDENGCPVNPLDEANDRFGCNNQAPADTFDPARIAYDLDRIVNADGTTRASSNHAFLDPNVGPTLRDGATDSLMAGPLGARLIQLLTDPVNGLVLDSWYDADGQPRGALVPPAGAGR